MISISILKRQFETAASNYHRLNHLMLESPDDQREKLNGPYPVPGCRRLEDAMATYVISGELRFRIKDPVEGFPKIGRMMGSRAHEIAALYVAGEYRPLDVFHHYSTGRDLFKQLAERAGELLLDLPAEIVNVYPPDWQPFEQYLKTYGIQREGLPGEDGHPAADPAYFAYDAILPPGNSWSERWASYLHWQGWSGETPGSNAKRQTWVGNTTFPLPPSKAEHEKMRAMGPFQSLPGYDECRHFFSVVENVFLCSALTLDHIEMRLTQEPARRQQPEPERYPPRPAVSLPISPSNDPDLSGSSAGQELPVLAGNSRNKVFICYSHSDSRWMKRLQVHLSPLERDGKLERWDDSRIRTSQDWREEIRKTIDSTKVAVLLISADFLASEFIAQNELPPLLAAAKDEGAFIMPVILSACRFAETVALEKFQAVNPALKPLVGMSHHNREKVWVQLTEDILDALSGKIKK